MAKTIYLNSISDSTITTLSAYVGNMVTVEAYRQDVRSQIKELEEEKSAKIAEMNTAIEEGTLSFDDAKAKYSTLDIQKKINALQEEMKETLTPFNQARSEMLKGLCMKDLYVAYVVGVGKGDFSAKGTVTISKKKKDGEITSKDFTTQKSFNTLLGDWLLELGLKNADNEGAVRRYAKNYLIPFIGTKVDKLNADLTAYSQTIFADTLLVAFKKSLIKSGTIVQNESINESTGYPVFELARAKNDEKKAA